MFGLVWAAGGRVSWRIICIIRIININIKCIMRISFGS